MADTRAWNAIKLNAWASVTDILNENLKMGFDLLPGLNGVGGGCTGGGGGCGGEGGDTGGNRGGGVGMGGGGAGGGGEGGDMERPPQSEQSWPKEHFS